MAAQNILEVMTIFSIKEQKQYKTAVPKEVKKSYSRKRDMFQSLVADKKGPLKFKKRKYFCVEEEPDISLDKVYTKKIHSFAAFVNKVRYSNNMSVSALTLGDRFNGEKVKVFVGKGNNRYLIIALLRRRFWLEITHRITADTKFVWSQNSIKDVHAVQKKTKFPVSSKKVKTDVTDRKDEESINNPENRQPSE
jgi:hypothetical protein